MPQTRKAARDAMGLADQRRRRNKIHGARALKAVDAAISKLIGVRAHRPPLRHPTETRAPKRVPTAAHRAVTGYKIAHPIARPRREAIAAIARPDAVRR
tara:strand:+ start:2982 stop:3278 length:297 start_codon:yes stop_codon:yes gene_type:complete